MIYPMTHLYQLAVTLDSHDVKNIPTASASDVLSGVLTTIYFLAGVVAVISIIVGGFLYTTSNGDASKVKTAKDVILYAVVGLVVVAMAFTITGFVIGKF